LVDLGYLNQLFQAKDNSMGFERLSRPREEMKPRRIEQKLVANDEGEARKDVQHSGA